MSLIIPWKATMTFTDKISVNMGNNMEHQSKIMLRLFFTVISRLTLHPANPDSRSAYDNALIWLTFH